MGPYTASHTWALAQVPLQRVQFVQATPTLCLLTWPTCFLSIVPEKSIYSITVESLPGLVSGVQSISSQSNSWRASLPYFQTVALSGGQEIPLLLWPLSPKLIVLRTARVLLCSSQCWVYASFLRARLIFIFWISTGHNLSDNATAIIIMTALGSLHLATKLLHNRQQITSSPVPQLLLLCAGGKYLYHSPGNPTAEHCWHGQVRKNPPITHSKEDIHRNLCVLPAFRCN